MMRIGYHRLLKCNLLRWDSDLGQANLKFLYKLFDGDRGIDVSDRFPWYVGGRELCI